MKTRNLFLSLFAFAAICACNKEAQPEVPQVLDAETYVKVNIMATGSSTKADPTYELGTENDVHNVLFLFYGATNKPVAQKDFSWSDLNPTGQNVAKSATIKFQAQIEKPTSMVVLLNYDENVSYATMTLEELKNSVTDSYSIKVGGTEYFTMTNSVYDNKGIVCETKLVDANFGKGTAGLPKDEDKYYDAITPVDVYVERVAAKVRFKATSITAQSTEQKVDGETVTITPAVKGYSVIDTPTASYDLKHISTDWTYSSVANGAPAWNRSEDFRSFWALMPDAAKYEFTDVTYNDVSIDGEEEQPAYVYVHENTSDTHTKVILVAELQVDGAAVDLVRYNDTYYTLAEFKKLAVDQIQDMDADVEINVGMLDTVSGESNGLSNGYEMVLKLNTNYTGDDTDDINTALGKMSALYWNGGKCYYYTDIKHDLYKGEELQSGVVRNHVYELTLNSVSGLGVPVPDPDQPITPETPSDEFYSLNAKINILQWRLVTQTVDFK